jgi:hypothetical protein
VAKLYKCYNCDDPKRQVPGRDFTADKPVCPECGLDGSDPIVAHRIVERRVIHFEPPHPSPSDCGSGKIACGCPGAGKQVTRAIRGGQLPGLPGIDPRAEGRRPRPGRREGSRTRPTSR